MRIWHITLNDISIEKRIHNQIESGFKAGYKIRVLAPGRKAQPRLTRQPNYILWRIRGDFSAGGAINFILFNLKVFLFLLFQPARIIHCHDLWPLPAAALASLLKNCPLVYDAHEFYAGLHIFKNRPIRKSIWMLAEWLAIPLADVLITVSSPLAELYRRRYPQLKEAKVIRNLPSKKNSPNKETIKLDHGSKEYLLLFQGHFKPGRGLPALLQAMTRIENAKLALVGGGELKSELLDLAAALDLGDKVDFYDYVPADELPAVTVQADIGIALFESTSVNYAYALPNKFFEYIQAGVPVLCGNIETFRRYQSEWNIGCLADGSDPDSIAKALKEMLSDNRQLDAWRSNCRLAADELNWENESEKIYAIYKNLAN